MKAVLTEGPVKKVNVERLTNGCFAFVLLLLVKNIPVPSMPEFLLSPEGSRYIFALAMRSVPEILIYINVFVILAYFWLMISYVFHRVRVVDRNFIYIHLFTLFCLIFIPFTSVLADVYTNDPTIFLFLHLNVLFFGIGCAALWLYAAGRGNLLCENITKPDRWSISVLILGVPGTAVIGMFLSFFDFMNSGVIYFVAMPFFWFLYLYQGSGEDRKKIREGGETKTIPVSGTCPYEGIISTSMAERLMSGVFAFTMTLIVKNIPLPATSDTANMAVLISFLERIIFEGFSFLFVFIVLSFFWLITFEIARGVRVIEPFLIVSELFFLMVIVLIPVSNLYLMYSELNSLLAVVFHLNVLIASIALLLTTLYLMYNPSCLAVDFSPATLRLIALEIIVILVASAFGTFQSFFGLNMDFFLYLLAAICIVVLGRRNDKYYKFHDQKSF